MRGADHSQYKNDKRTIEAMAEYSRMSAEILTLRDISDQLNMFSGGHTRGRKPNGYERLKINSSDEMLRAILKIKKHIE